MTSKIARITHDVDAYGALEKMPALGIRRHAVTNSNGAIVGVLSFDDLVDGLAVEVVDLARIIRQARTREAGMCQNVFEKGDPQLGHARDSYAQMH